ncbi:MAG: hypothetical protein RIQ93_575 [Verrucomicrobiota bacterium]|jgi:hypothetical protein
MNKTPIQRALLLAGVLALAVTGRTQVIEFRATINAAQEIPDSTSPATGSAIMLYDIATNKFDLIVTISNFANTATASHLHEGAPGVAGNVVTNLGGETAYLRDGNTLRQTFRDITHGGNKLTLIQGGAYLNIHSAAFPGGEVRGQLIPQPVKLVSNITVAQEQAAFPAVNLTGANLNDFGGAVMIYDPVANRVNLRLSVYNFNNVMSNSHFHEGAPAVSGPVRVNLGNSANAGGYTTANGHIAGTFDISYAPGDPLLLLSGGAYLNFHSTTFAGGEGRGQVRVSNEIPSTRLSNLSVRGFVGTGEQVLIQGLTVNGPDPVRVLITAKGPSLTQFGIASALANPRVGLFDSGGRQIAFNDDVGVVPATSDLATIPGVPTNALESAMTVVLPPGNYTAIVSAAAGTGVALLEITDLRNGGIRAVAEAPVEPSLAMLR